MHVLALRDCTPIVPVGVADLLRKTAALAAGGSARRRIDIRLVAPGPSLDRFPRVQVLPQAILVDRGRVVTAGGATSFINLTLHLAERIFGADVARMASKMFLVDVNKAPQSAYAMFSSQKLHDDRDVLRAQSMIERHPERTPSIAELARAVAMSERTFARRFRQATGNPALEYVQRVKIEAAERALDSGELVSSVAGLVGYSDAAAFRRLFTRVTGLTPAEYRARYGPKAMPSTVVIHRGRRRNEKRRNLSS